MSTSLAAVLDNQDIEGWTPLHDAAAHGHFGCVKTLLRLRAKADVQDRYGWVPHAYAIYNGHLQVARLFRKRSRVKGRSRVAVGSKSASQYNDNSMSPMAAYRKHRESLARHRALVAEASESEDSDAGETDTEMAITAVGLKPMPLVRSFSQQRRNMRFDPAAHSSGLGMVLEDGDSDEDASGAVPETTLSRTKSNKKESRLDGVPAGKARIEFQVRANLRDGQTLVIVGGCPELGDWRVERGVRMRQRKADEDEVDTRHRVREVVALVHDGDDDYDDQDVAVWVATVNIDVERVNKSSGSATVDPSRSEEAADEREAKSVAAMATDSSSCSVGYKYIVTSDKKPRRPRSDSVNTDEVVGPHRAPGSLQANVRVTSFTSGSYFRVDDGTFGVHPSGDVTAASVAADSEESTDVWVATSWLRGTCQLQLLLGHVTEFPHKAVVTSFVGPLELDQIVVHFGAGEHSMQSPWHNNNNNSNSSNKHGRGKLVAEGNDRAKDSSGDQNQSTATNTAGVVIAKRHPLVPHAMQRRSATFPLSDPVRQFKFVVDERLAESDMHLRFELYSGIGPPVARAHVLSRMMIKPDSLQGRMTVPLINQAHDVIGELAFEYLFVRPFSHPRMNTAAGRTFSKSLRVIGHRGAGAEKNAVSGQYRRSHIKENTILSFITAWSQGAQFVEFDVQLTADKVPVVYHDFLFKIDTGRGHVLSVPLNEIRLADYKRFGRNLKKSRSYSDLHGPLARARELGLMDDDSVALLNRPLKVGGRSDGVNSNSISTTNNGSGATSRASDVLFGVTAAGKTGSSMSMRAALGAFDLQLHRAPNDENDEHDDDDADDDEIESDSESDDDDDQFHIQDIAATLEETMARAPPTLGFNIEIKYPNQDERQQMHLKPVDRNEYVDQVLRCVFEHAGSRPIIFSSFDPDICKLVTLKQPTYPVLFLTEGGVVLSPDPRCNSLQRAVQFATRNNLLGLVADASPLVMAPEVIEWIKNRGLLLCTYGVTNNNPASVALQQRHGVDSIITDHVAHVVKAMK